MIALLWPHETVLFALLGAFALVHARNLAQRRQGIAQRPTYLQVLIGFATNFFDTLGIGNFAPTTAAYRIWRVVPDALIPGTMNVGHTLPVVAMAFIFIGVIEVDATTLVTMIAAAILGSWLGAGVVTRLPQRAIQVGMGLAMLTAAALFMMAHFEAFPVGGDALALSGGELAIACVSVALFGALQTIGIGLYAPCMILVALLGMNPKAAFPIMMGACAFLMPVASARFIHRDKYDHKAALGLTFGGLPAVFLAAYVVVSLPLTSVRWLVIVVSGYAGISMLLARGGSSRTH
ncbi:MAG: putative membrane protein YfcA [Planctomycetota bacterium]